MDDGAKGTIIYENERIKDIAKVIDDLIKSLNESLIRAWLIKKGLEKGN